MSLPPFPTSSGPPTPTLPGLADGIDAWRPQKGDLLGRYVILQPIGRGGMGAVYAAYDPELDRKVAIKILLAGPTLDGAHAEAHRRLRREAKALAKLNHPNVLAVFDVGDVEGRVFIATELVEGQDLHRWLTTQRTRRQVLRTFLAAGEGLAAAHGEGIVHRDFKPGNVMIDSAGRVRVVDFGLARVAQVNGAHRASTTDNMPTKADGLSVGHGTPAYMAPEQRAGQAATARSDQYSFCLALFEALYGRAWPGTEAEVPARSPVGRVPSQIRAALRRGLTPSAADRFDSMSQLVGALRARPWPTRWPYQALAATPVVVFLAYFLFSTTKPCRNGKDKLASAWSPSRRNQVATTVGAPGDIFAREASRTVVQAFDGYAAAWIEMHREICLATHSTGEQSEELLDLRMTCLDRRLTEFSTLAGLLSEPQAVPPQRAVRAARSLVPLVRCTDVRALRARQRLPEAIEVRTRIEEIENRLANARTQRIAGRFAIGQALAETVVTEADEIGYWPLKAESLLTLGRLRMDQAQAEEAKSAFEEAWLAAGAGSDHRTATEAAIRLVKVNGYQLADFDRGHEYAAYARSMLDQLSAPAELAGILDDYVGTLFYQQDNYSRALEHHQRALTSISLALGDGSPEVADTLTRLGNVASALGQHSEALDNFKRALDIHRSALGPNHPRTATSHDRVGVARHNLADFDGAEESHRRALEIRQTVFGPKDPRVASSWMHLGNISIAQGRFDQGLELFALAYEIFLGQDKNHPNVALALTSQGIALHWLQRFDEAIDHYQRARKIQRQVYGDHHTSVASTDFNLGETWLEKGDAGVALKFFRAARGTWETVYDADHYTLGDALTGEGKALVDLDKASEAVPVLERALAIRVVAELDPTRLASTRFALARALQGNGQESARAISLARQARDGLISNPRRNQDELADISSWLTAHDGV